MVCPYKCSNEKQFLGHVQFHQGTNRIRLYQCVHCDFSTNEMANIEDHLFDTHPDDLFKFEVSGMQTKHMQEANACILCYQVFDSQCDVLEHVGLVHEPHLPSLMHLFGQISSSNGQGQVDSNVPREDTDEEMNEEPDEEEAPSQQVYQPLIDRFHCDYCEFDTSSKATLIDHLRDVHGQVLASYGEDEQEETTDITERVTGGKSQPRSRGRTVHQCPSCPFRSERIDNFQKHMEIHERNKNLQNGFKCGHCDLRGPKRGPVVAHLKRYHPGMEIKVITIGRGSFPVKKLEAPAVEEEPLPKRARVIPARYTQPYSTTSLSPGKVPKTTEAVPALPKQLTQTSSSLQSLEQCLPDALVFRHPIQCPHCRYSTKVRMNLIRHVKSHETPSATESPTSANATSEAELSTDQVGVARRRNH